MAPTASEQPEKPPIKRKSRPIVLLGSFLVSHSVFFSVACCSAGLVALLLLPVLAKNTYISENALLPGSANPMYSALDVQQAKKFATEALERSITEEGRRIEIPRLIEKHVADVGGEAYHHGFNAGSSKFHPMHFFSCISSTSDMESNNNCSSSGVNSVGIIRAPRGDGKEAIVLVTPYNSQNIQLNEALSLGLGYSIFSFLSRVTWLAKDIVWLAADSQYGEYSAVEAWLKDYHNPVSIADYGKIDISICRERNDEVVHRTNSNVFKRSGTMAAALVFKVTDNKERSERDRLDMYVEASNGQMPNLDLINTVHYLAVHRQGMRVVVGMIDSLLDSACLKLIGGLVETISKLAKRINPKWKFETTSAEFVEGTSTLASSIIHQALGVPTGPHGAFRDYQVDAITLDLSPQTYLHNENAQSAFLLRSGRLIEGTIRSVNNLLEKFHQSFFLYFLTAPNKFVSVGVYMIPFALLVAPLPIVAAALFSSGRRKRCISAYTSSSVTSDAESESDSWRWIPATKVVFMIHLWAGIVSLLPYYLSQLSGLPSTTNMLLWAGFSIVVLLILYYTVGPSYAHSRVGEWRVLKAVTIAAACMGLSLMSIINFSTAQIGAMLLVPMCLMIRPYRCLDAGLSLLAILLACNLAFGVVGFPPAGLLISKGLSDGFRLVNVGDIWGWAEFLWSQNSATYLFLLLVHLPCWTLCMHILMHP